MMKAYIIYIATLLAALALPANGQTASTDTKAAPDAPAMPYKLSLVTTGGNNGTVTVEDNDPNGNGMTIVGNDTLFYGASGSNATTVKLTVTPNPGYIIRKGYPKGYKTGDPRPDGALSDYTFKMPHFPLTIEVAYAHQIKSIAAITLKEAATADNVVSKLPGYIHITLGNGRKDSLAVNSWAFVGKGTGTSTDPYDTTEGAANRFKATLASALPDSIADATVPLFMNNTCTVVVANKAKPLQPADDSEKITILPGTGDNLNSKEGQGGEEPFNGTIKDATVKELEISKDVKDATLTLSGVTVADNGAGTTTIQGDSDPNKAAKLTLRLEGTNNLGTLTIGENATVILDKVGDASLGATTITNAGTFIDSTATVTQVTGNASLNINGSLTGDLEVNVGAKITLKASTNEGTGSITFIWQKKVGGSFTDIEGATTEYENGTPQPTRTTTVPGITNEYKVNAATTGDAAEYRCLIKRTASAVTTLLSTQPAKVEVKTGGGDTPPPYVPAYYTVTLPAVEGLVLTPGAGSYTIEEGTNFTFALTLPEGYTGNIPAVTTSRGETLTPRLSDGKYIIRNVQENITVSIASFPTGIDRVETGGIRTWSTPGTLHINTTKQTLAAIYTLTGSCIRQISLSPGNNQAALPSGIYILVADKWQQKVIVR